MEKNCLECGEKIHGRSDKKFCGEMCRNNYHNKLNSVNTNYIRNVNNILRRNRRILQDLISDDTEKAGREKLINRGFNFNYFTHQRTTKKGSKYYFCYEYGVAKLEENTYFLVKRHEDEWA